jgi:predicted phosphoribosyltransferase
LQKEERGCVNQTAKEIEYYGRVCADVEKYMIFKDRAQAGALLAQKLKKFQNSNAVVYALPRGGVVLGAEIAKELNIPLDLVVARKIGHPFSPEYAIGAITENGEKVLNELETMDIDPDWLQSAIEKELTEAKRRRKLYTEGRTMIPAKGKIALLVDDGIATGLTMQAAIQGIKKQKPASVVIAVPVSPKETAQRFRESVNEFVALDIPEFYAGAVGAYYVEFHQLTDDDVIRTLKSVNRLKAVS